MKEISLEIEAILKICVQEFLAVMKYIRENSKRPIPKECEHYSKKWAFVNLTLSLLKSIIKLQANWKLKTDHCANKNRKSQPPRVKR